MRRSHQRGLPGQFQLVSDPALSEKRRSNIHNNDVIMSAMATQITSASIVCSAVCSGADQRKQQSSTSLAFLKGIHWWPVDPPHKGPVMQNMFLFDNVIMHIHARFRLNLSGHVAGIFRDNKHNTIATDHLVPCATPCAVGYHQQPWCWLRYIYQSLSSARKDFKCLNHFTVEKW